MKHRSTIALPDGFVVRAVNSPDPQMAAEALLPHLLAFLDANAGAEDLKPKPPSTGVVLGNGQSPRRPPLVDFALTPGCASN